MAFSDTDIQTILQFFIEQLPEDKLAELDARIDGSASADEPAMDAAMAKRKTWAAMDSHTRQAIRQSRQADSRKKAADMAEFEKRFPQMNRLGR